MSPKLLFSHCCSGNVLGGVCESFCHPASAQPESTSADVTHPALGEGTPASLQAMGCRALELEHQKRLF